MHCVPTILKGVQTLHPAKSGDARGFFSETYSRAQWLDVGIGEEFVQDNHSCSADKWVVRGLHYQLPPMAQAKLIRVTHGAIRDVVVDIQRDSPTFGRHVVTELSARNWRQIFIPAGFAHGFVTLEEQTEVLYKVSNHYAPHLERGIRWNDPALKIAWEFDASAAIVSPRDRSLPLLKDADRLF